ncbi:MAG: hypothetical protein VW905_02560 [Gammaproteobacteria bacterium]
MIKLNMNKLLSIFAIFLMILGCNLPGNKPDKKEAETFELLGLFQGTQDSYYLKNKFGDDLLIQGKRVPVPSIEYKFLFENNSKVSLQQSSKDGDRAYYDGNYTVIENDDKIVLIECKLSDGEYSNPTMTIEFSKLNNRYTYRGMNFEPDFNLTKIK